MIRHGRRQLGKGLCIQPLRPLCKHHAMLLGVICADMPSRNRCYGHEKLRVIWNCRTKPVAGLLEMRAKPVFGAAFEFRFGWVNTTPDIFGHEPFQVRTESEPPAI